MNYWKNKYFDLGVIQVGSVTKITYLANKNIPNILKIKSSCGCAKPKYNPKTNQLTINYKAGSIPRHLISRGSYTTMKKITITYITGQKDILTFKAKIIK